ncbi:hypothetical protein F5Y03DRAFT_344858 [Xylaria venustula]|nr:hypothetical protein F5Y03DRAFT_344858 [Xylaria venustula]
MDELESLLLSPYREIAEKAKTAIENAKNAGNSAPPLMLQSAEKVLKGSERSLKHIEALSASYYEQYGRDFINAVKEHGIPTIIFELKLHNLKLT